MARQVVGTCLIRWKFLRGIAWTGRQIVAGKREAIPEPLSPILMRLGIEASGWLVGVSNFARLIRAGTGW